MNSNNETDGAGVVRGTARGRVGCTARVRSGSDRCSMSRRWSRRQGRSVPGRAPGLRAWAGWRGEAGTSGRRGSARG
jgi:hypothetical protein